MSLSRRHSRRIPRTTTSVLLLVVISLFGLAACGSGGDSTSSASSGSSAEIDIDADAVLATAFEGDYQDAPAEGPTAQTGKNIWISNCASYPVCRREAEGFSAAAKELGWTTKVVDNKADPAVALQNIRQAISAKADGIVVLPFDCSLLQSGLKEAKAAGIPVLGLGLDCNADGGESLFAAPLKFLGKDNPIDIFVDVAERNADFVLAQIKQQGVKDPKILQNVLNSGAGVIAGAKKFKDTIEAKCPSCEIVQVEHTLAQMAAGKGPSIFKAAVLANPDANVLYYDYSVVLDQGLKTAIQGKTGEKYEITCCGNAELAGISFLTKDGDLAKSSFEASNAAFEWYGWALADIMNRTFAGEAAEDMPNQGGSVFFVDKDHNLPATVEDWPEPTYDFKAAYTKVWKG